MESIYEQLFSCKHMFSEQAARWIFEHSLCENICLAVGNPERHFWYSESEASERAELDEGTLDRICDRIDDGCDPAVIRFEGGCVIGSELYTDSRSAGYVVLILKGYTPETIEVNGDLFELLFSQFRLVCMLLEKNNQLHHLQLTHLSRSSSILSGAGI